MNALSSISLISFIVSPVNLLFTSIIIKSLFSLLYDSFNSIIDNAKTLFLKLLIPIHSYFLIKHFLLFLLVVTSIVLMFLINLRDKNPPKYVPVA